MVREVIKMEARAEPNVLRDHLPMILHTVDGKVTFTMRLRHLAPGSPGLTMMEDAH